MNRSPTLNLSPKASTTKPKTAKKGEDERLTSTLTNTRAKVQITLSIFERSPHV